MEFRQSESQLSGEVEYLAALFAFKDQTLSADELQLAIARFVSGESTTILEAIRSLGVVEPVRLAASIKMAEIYCNGNTTRPSPRRQRSEFTENALMPRLQHHSLGDDSDDAIEFDDASEQPAAPVGQEFEWQPSSDWASHVYYVEDTLRGYTGGRLGIVSTFALCICVGVIIWGAIESQIFVPSNDDGRTDRGVQNQSVDNQSVDMAETDPFDRAASASSTLSGASPDEDALPLEQTPIAEQTKNRSDEDVAPASDERVKGSTDSADDWLSIPISSVMLNDQWSTEPTPAPSAVADATERDLIDEELKVAMTELNTNDLPSARLRLSRIYDGKLADIDPQKDRRWLQFGIGVMLEQDTPESIETASQWLRFTHADNQPLNRILFARWLLRTSLAQKGVLAEHFAQDPAPSEPLNHWLLAASGDYKMAIPMLEAELSKPSSDPLNHLFLAIAYYVANRPTDVLQQLDQFDAASDSWPMTETEIEIEIDVSESVVTESQWIKEASMKALDAAADKVRDRVSSAR